MPQAANRILREAEVHFEEASFWATEGVKGKANCDEALKRLVQGANALGKAQAIASDYVDSSGVKESRSKAFYDVQRKCLIGGS